MIKLHLGCGSNRMPDYINIDLYDNRNVDVVHDLLQPLPYEDESVDEIYCSHVIEHFSRNEWEIIREDWKRVLKPGGVMHLRCPDLEQCIKYFLSDHLGAKWTYWIKTIYGYQGHEGEPDVPGQFHKNGFTFEKLAEGFPEWKGEHLPGVNEYELETQFTKPNH